MLLFFLQYYWFFSRNDVGYFTEDERNVSLEYNNVNFIREKLLFH